MDKDPFDHGGITGGTWLDHFLRRHKDKRRKPSLGNKVIQLTACLTVMKRASLF
jgi:hypothetical protein